jgi:hypothetical protein
LVVSTAEDPVNSVAIDKRRRNFIVGVVGRRWWSDNKSIDAPMRRKRLEL